MIYLMYGTDTDSALKKAQATIASLQKKKPDASFIKVENNGQESLSLDEYIGGQGLFENKQLIFFDRVLENKKVAGDILDRLTDMQKSENIFIFLEGAPTKAILGKFEKRAEKITEYAKAKSEIKADKFDVFSLTNALGAGDKKQLWMLYLRAQETGSVPEQIHGLLFWKVKDMLVKKNTRAYDESTLKTMSGELVSLYHDSHRGLCDFSLALEAWVLKR
jgi:DNA polymerase III delta subunit